LKKIKGLFEFYKSTFLFNFGFSLLLLYFLNFKSDSRAILHSIPFAYLLGSLFSLLLTLFLKEINKNRDYLFYFNCNLSKLQLYSFSLIINLVIVFVLLLIFR